jgi:hypothetical protein
METGNLMIDAQTAFARQRRRRRLTQAATRLRGRAPAGDALLQRHQRSLRHLLGIVRALAEALEVELAELVTHPYRAESCAVMPRWQGGANPQ